MATMKTRTFVGGEELGVKEAKRLGFRCNRGWHIYTPDGRYTHVQGWHWFVKRRLSALDVTRGIAASLESFGRALKG